MPNRKNGKPVVPKKRANNRIIIPRFYRPKTKNQEIFFESIVKKPITICTGPAGCGKTAISVSWAAEGLYQEAFSRVVLTRPIVEAGEKIGFLPGTAEEKIHPYLLPIFDEFANLFDREQIFIWKQEGRLEIAPLAYLRGRNLHNSCIILDEGQNATYDQIKMLITRIGKGSKLIINGDMSQSDLPFLKKDGLKKITEKLSKCEEVGVVTLDRTDILRSPVIAKVLAALED